MSDERFFEQVKTQFEGFSPEVPQGVYGGMRRKLWWSKFTSPDMHRFNMWYLLLFVGMASAGTYALTSQQTSVATMTRQHEPAPVVLTEMPAAQPEALTESSCGHVTDCSTKKNCASACGTGKTNNVSNLSIGDMNGTTAGRSSTPSGDTGMSQNSASEDGGSTGDESAQDGGVKEIEPVSDEKTDGAVTNTTKTSTDKPSKRKQLLVPVYGGKK
ncbi:MAG: hypothetical protein RL220_1969 [Bacteroidota bacterium]|jgi:hypothetical protein